MPSFTSCLIRQQPLLGPQSLRPMVPPTASACHAGCPLARQDIPLGSLPSDILSLALGKCQSWPDRGGCGDSHCCPLPLPASPSRWPGLQRSRSGGAALCPQAPHSPRGSEKPPARGHQPPLPPEPRPALGGAVEAPFGLGTGLPPGPGGRGKPQLWPEFPSFSAILSLLWVEVKTGTITECTRDVPRPAWVRRRFLSGA